MHCISSALTCHGSIYRAQKSGEWEEMNTWLLWKNSAMR